MIHEFKDIVESCQIAIKEKKNCVLATLVDLDGSAYRRPGVRMLLTEDGQMTGAISGGCIEKDVLTESVSVFKTGIAKMMTYDGRYRLGCDGMIYILLEKFNPPSKFIADFNKCLEKRESFTISSYYSRELSSAGNLGSTTSISGHKYPLNQAVNIASLEEEGNLTLHQELPPMFHLVIFGGEYDAAKLCRQASLLGWQVTLVTTPLDGYTTSNFPGSSKVLQSNANQLPDKLIDKDTAVVIMTHNYAKDLSYLIAIRNSKPSYLGLLGPVKRRNRILDEMLEQSGEISDTFLDLIHGPAGLNIGAETAEEIAMSICSEIIADRRKKDGVPLRNFEGEIHSDVSN